MAPRPDASIEEEARSLLKFNVLSFNKGRANESTFNKEINTLLRGLTGSFSTISSVGGETAKSFTPNPLPPNPPLAFDGELQEKLDQALLSLGRLDSVSTLLSDTNLFLYSYIRKEAVLSSQIEGTQSSLSDLLLFELDETPGVPIDDVQQVSNYVSALNYGLQRIKDGFPISNRLIREIHKILLAEGRGSDKEPGEFRRSQNWIGGTRPGNAKFVPPPVEQMVQAMSDLEKFLHNQPVRTSTLLKAALAHVQFETIHPFLDGNGRVGRLLITLLFCAEKVLHDPLLYLSLYMKVHRDHYYELLQDVRLQGDWESWISFFAEAVHKTSEGATHTAQKLVQLFQKDRDHIADLKRGTNSALRIHEALSKRPISNIRMIAQKTKLSVPAVTSSFGKLSELGIVKEITGHRRNRIFVYDAYLKTIESNWLPGTDSNRRPSG